MRGFRTFAESYWRGKVTEFVSLQELALDVANPPTDRSTYVEVTEYDDEYIVESVAEQLKSLVVAKPALERHGKLTV